MKWGWTCAITGVTIILCSPPYLLLCLSGDTFLRMEWLRIVERLRARLLRYRISQRQLARAMGRAPTQVNRWFRGRAVPTLASVARMEAAIESVRMSRKASAGK